MTFEQLASVLRAEGHGWAIMGRSSWGVVLMWHPRVRRTLVVERSGTVRSVFVP